jgi:hypothetical protein
VAELVGVAQPRCGGAFMSDISNGESGDISIGDLQARWRIIGYYGTRTGPALRCSEVFAASPWPDTVKGQKNSPASRPIVGRGYWRMLCAQAGSELV